jgi:hypothetical protein
MLSFNVILEVGLSDHDGAKVALHFVFVQGTLSGRHTVVLNINVAFIVGLALSRKPTFTTFINGVFVLGFFVQL